LTVKVVRRRVDLVVLVRDVDLDGN